MDDDQPPDGVTAYHGSPHDFDQFDLSKIGTGEGAQAYGHGLYFAEAEDVARGYRDALTQKSGGASGYIDVDPNQPIKAIRSELSNRFGAGNYKITKNGELHVKRDFGWSFEGYMPRPGRMYEVNIAAHPDHFLDWDKPLAKQSAHIASAMDRMHDDDALPDRFKSEVRRARSTSYFDGADLYAELQKLLGKEETSRFLSSHGVHGIKYLDQGSRAAGDGSRNYVVFDDKLVKVNRKYAQGGEVDEDGDPGIPVWHGSGSDFDRFSLDHVGSGMRAQAFGHGLYFSESPMVAREYRDTITKDEPKADWRIGDAPIGDYYEQAMRRADEAPNTTMAGEYDKLGAIEDLMNVGDAHGVRQFAQERYRPETIDWFESKVAPKFQRPGKLYQAEIAAKPHEFLDWDKKISDQPHILKAIGEHLGDPETVLQQLGVEPAKARGSHLYYALSSGMQQGKEASAKLSSMGVHGVTYADDFYGSREPVRNYVVFDDRKVKIKNKYKRGGVVSRETLHRSSGGVVNRALMLVSKSRGRP